MLKIIDYKLPAKTFGQKVNLPLLAQANHVYNDRAHIGLRNTKTRGEVNRTTKKVYKQKGTGGARHGSRRANLFVGGGVIFGPRPLKRVLELSKSLKAAALVAAFSAKNKDKGIMVVSGIDKITKTNEVSSFLKKLEGRRFVFLLSAEAHQAYRFFRNLANARALDFKDANAFDIITGGKILIDEAVFQEKDKVEKVAPASTVKAKVSKARPDKPVSKSVSKTKTIKKGAKK